MRNEIQQDLIKRAADQLRNAAKTGEACAPIRELIGTDDLELAYAIQDSNHSLRIKSGARIVGKKIGLTSFAVQKQLGVDQPDFGLLFADMEVPNNGAISFSKLQQPKAEAELAFVLKENLSDQISLESVTNAVDYVMASIEIVGSRIENWDIRITDTIADNASASHFVLGQTRKKLTEVDLVGCAMSLSKNGEVASTGIGSACMDNPLNAVLWLARKMKEIGRPLEKGEIILSGAMGPMVPFSAGDRIEATIQGFDPISFQCD